MASEGVVQKQIIGALGMLSRLFRLNGGKAWMSNLGPKGVITLEDGSKLIRAPRPVGLGFTMTNGDSVPGQSDLGGWTEVTITPAMVGKQIAVFTAIETKRTTGGKASSDQLSFVDQVQRQGGIAGIANSVEAARKIIEQWASKIGAIL
jgi:hypothetical protein